MNPLFMNMDESTNVRQFLEILGYDVEMHNAFDTSLFSSPSPGARLVDIWETDDGIVACFVRPKTEFAAMLFFFSKMWSEGQQGAIAILKERWRQLDSEGWTAQHDDNHQDDQLIKAGVAYALEAILRQGYYRADYPDPMIDIWPWEESQWKPSDDPVRNLEKAGALIAAEIDRLKRAKERGYDTP